MAPRIEIITERGRFAEIQPQWDALWRCCKADVFQNHAWIAAWLEASGEYKATRIAVAWQGHDILAAMPLSIRQRFGLRILEWSAQSLSDYCDTLATPDAVSYLPLLWHEVWQAGGFDMVNIAQVRPDAVARSFFDLDMKHQAVTERRDRQERCFAIDCVWPSSEAWFRSLGKKGRNNHWRGERILAALGGEVAFHSLDPTEQSIDSELRHVIALKWQWLRTTKPSSSLLGRDGRTLEGMLRAATRSGLMKLFLLTCGDRIAAASVNFVRGDRMQAYMTSYDPAFDRASPGAILIVRYTRWAFDNGLKQVDFLRGDEAFKSRLANAEINLASYVGVRTAIGKTALVAHHLRSWFRGAGSVARAEPAAVGSAASGSPHLGSGT
jgi:CelD/BcsL family acetyltransferase involved in cellulose biosynthesis